MSDKTEYSAVHFFEGKLNLGGPRDRFLDTTHRITRDGETILVEERPGQRRVYELPRSVCVLERKILETTAAEGRKK